MHHHYILTVICLTIVCAFAQPDKGTVVHFGQATYYNATGAGNYGFDATHNGIVILKPSGR